MSEPSETKALLIESQVTKSGGETGKWNDFSDAPSYIQGIHTKKILKNVSAEELSSLISGIPTPWARAKLFKFAFETIASPDPNINPEGLMQFYDMLHAEWRGLITVMALYPKRISFSKPVFMNVEESKNNVESNNYNMAGIFGRMLFDDKDLWINPAQWKKDHNDTPFIQLIYYKEQLVGGTSPLTGCFTGVDYSKLNDASDIQWYRQGKFEDPMTYNLSPEELQQIYLFIKNMDDKILEFQNAINLLRSKKQEDLNGFKQIIRNWLAELKEKLQGKFKDNVPVIQYDNFNLSCPFDYLFKNNMAVNTKPDLTSTNPIEEVKKELRLKKKITLRRKENPAEFTFKDSLEVKLLWKSKTDLDLCIFFKTKSGEIGGVFPSNRGSLSEFPFMLHKGDEIEPTPGGESIEQITIANLSKIDTANVCVVNNNAEEINFAQNSGRVEIQSDSGDYLEVLIDAAENGRVYHVCSIKNKEGINFVIPEGTVMDLNTASKKISGFYLICD